jgi:hypothetical protein
VILLTLREIGFIPKRRDCRKAGNASLLYLWLREFEPLLHLKLSNAAPQVGLEVFDPQRVIVRIGASLDLLENEAKSLLKGSVSAVVSSSCLSMRCLARLL